MVYVLGEKNDSLKCNGCYLCIFTKDNLHPLLSGSVKKIKVLLGKISFIKLPSEIICAKMLSQV